MKNVLMIIPFFPPTSGGGVYRPLSFVRGLAQHGWQPTVVAPDGAAYWVRDRSLCRRIPEDVCVVRTRTLSGQSLLARMRPPSNRRQTRSSARFAPLRRVAAAVLIPDTYIGWYPFAVRAAHKLNRERRFDAIYSTSPPETAHLVARTISRRESIPWVADFRDPWMNLYLLDSAGPLQCSMHRRLEASVMRRAHVVVATRWHENAVRGRYPGTPVTRVANGYDADAAAIANASGAKPPADRLRMVHTGMLTQNRTVEPFLRALRRVIDRGILRADELEVILAGPREDANDAAVAAHHLTGVVKFIVTATHAEALELQRSAHVLLLVKHADPRYRGLVPGKLYEYIGARRPILALAPAGEARDLVVALGRGRAADPPDHAAIADNIECFIHQWRSGNLNTAYDLSPHPEFSREQRVGDLAAVLDAAREVSR